ncbi:hypothetical protein Tsubulata_014116, partial [Turnera subulata]
EDPKRLSSKTLSLGYCVIASLHFQRLIFAGIPPCLFENMPFRHPKTHPRTTPTPFHYFLPYCLKSFSS